MKKIFQNKLFIILIAILLVAGCGVKDGDKDTHYKPSEYKHNVALNKASATIDDVTREIVSMGAETSADVVYDTYKDSIAKLQQELSNLEATKKLLSEDEDLTKSEISRWTADYNSVIKGVENKIEDVQTKLEKFLK